MPINLDSVAPENFVYKYLSLDGLGASVEINVDASVVTKDFFYIVPSGRTFYLSRINFTIVDGSITPVKFAGLAALTTGCTLEVLDADLNQALDFLGGKTLKSNNDFANIAGVDSIIHPAAGDDAFPVRFTVNKAGKYVEIPSGYSIRFGIQDNLSGITKFRIMVQGILV